MKAGMRRWLLRTGGWVTALALASVSLAEAQQSSVGGVVTDEATGQPLEAARVLLNGPNRIETTNQEGRYHFRNVAPGSYAVRVLRLGYRPATDTANVAPGETVALDFALTGAPVQLDEIVTTATGEQRKLEVANAVSTIDAARIAEESPITEFGNLLSGRAAGVQVQKSGGTTGTGTRIRIRGSNSVSLSNEPLYYIDGVRMESNPTSSSLDIGGFGQGVGAGPSRINDLNPEDIESIEIVKGPAAATLYGIQASNGVVRITTKRGRAGKARWNLYSEVGAVTDHNTYPINFNGRDADNPDFDGFCTLQFELDGFCAQDSVSQFSPLDDPFTSPLKAGFRQQYGANVSGGNELLTYYLSADYEDEDGVYRLPRFEEDSIRADRGFVPDNQIRPNTLERVSLRANVGANVHANADIQANVGYTSSDTRFVENDNSFLTITGSAEASGVPFDFNRGWFFTPAELFAELANQGTERFIGGLTGNWRPTSWLSTRATLGYDVTNRTDVQFFPTGQVADYLQNRLGVRSDNRFQTTQTSVDLAATARFRLNPRLASKTSVGAQFYRDLVNGTFATGRILPAGSETITGAGVTEAREETIESRSLGTYVEQEFGFKERLFVTGALRFDDNSAFGRNFDATVYPKASVSWLISDEPFFGESSFLSTLRFRGAVGVSGQQPGTTDALRYYTPVAGKRANVAGTGVTFANLGNPGLKPERSREIELGFDASMLNDRVSMEFTYFTKTTRDALIERNVSPDSGRVRVAVLQPGRAPELRRRAGDQHPGHRRAQHGLGPVAERIGLQQPPDRAGRGRRADRLRLRTPAPRRGLSARRVLGSADHRLRRRQRQRHHRGRRSHRGRHGGLPRPRAAQQGSVAQQRPHAVRRDGSDRHPVRLPRRPLHRQRDRVVPLHPGLQLPRAQRPHGAAGGAGRAQAVVNEAHRVGLLRARLVHQAARALAHAVRARCLGPELPRQPPESHACRPQSVDHHRLLRCGSRGQCLRAGQLRHQRLRVAAAGAVLDRADQRRLLRAETMHRAILSPSLLLVAACGLLDTNQPDIVEPGDVGSPAGAEALYVGAISDFALAHDGDGDLNIGVTDGHVLESGLMADEFVLSTTPPTQQEIDQRRIFTNNSTLFAYYHYLHRARAAAETAAEALREFGPAPDEDPRIGEMQSLAGFSRIYLGEAFCAGVAFSRLEGDETVFGEPQTTAEIFQSAVNLFDAALAEPGTNLVDSDAALETFILASIGKARALLNLGDAAGAAAAVATVPTDFAYITEHADSPARLQNAIYGYSVGFLWSLSDLEGDNGLPYRTAEDPRVPFEDTEDVGLDGTTPQFNLLKYEGFDSPVIIAGGVEARLIEAEAQLAGGDIPGMTGTLNEPARPRGSR